MGYTTKFGNYVKFLRGTPDAWNSLDVKDSDTLYFIAEAAGDRGKLYLGNKLIADGNNAEINTLKSLKDVLIGEGVPNGSVLSFDVKLNKWKNTSLDSLLAEIVTIMTGASADKDGISGLVPQPKAGQQNLYLQGDGTWSDPTASLAGVVNQLTETVEQNKQKHITDMNTLMGGRGELTPVDDIVSEHIQELVGAAPETFDTLEELANWIAKHEGEIDIADTLARLSRVETTLNDPESGLVVRVEKNDTALWGSDSSTGLVAQVTTLVGDMAKVQGEITGIQGSITDITGDITEIFNLLKWQDLVSDNV